MRIQWTEAADDDLESVAAYISVDNPTAAVKQVIRVVTIVEELLSEHPAAGRPGRIPKTRELAVPGTRYIVAYRVKQGVIEVLRVLHGARKWPNRL